MDVDIDDGVLTFRQMNGETMNSFCFTRSGAVHWFFVSDKKTTTEYSGDIQGLIDRLEKERD